MSADEYKHSTLESFAQLVDFEHSAAGLNKKLGFWIMNRYFAKLFERRKSREESFLPHAIRISRTNFPQFTTNRCEIITQIDFAEWENGLSPRESLVPQSHFFFDFSVSRHFFSSPLLSSFITFLVLPMSPSV